MTPSSPTRTGRLLVAVAATVLTSSCAVPSGKLPGAPAAPVLPGSRGLVLTAAISPAELFAYDLSTKKRTAFQLPPDVEEVVGGRWVGRDAALVVLRASDGLAVYRVAASGRPEPIGEPIRAGRVDVHEGTVLASSCRFIGAPSGPSPGRFRPSGPDRQTGRIHVLDVDGAGRWTRAGTGCIAALSPEAEQVVHSPEGFTLWVSELGGDSTRKILDVRELDLRSASGKPFTIKGPIAWSDGGIAVAIDADGSDTIVRLSPAGDVQDVIPIDPQGRDFFMGLAWSPEGDRLAIPAYTYLGYVNATGSVLLAEDGVAEPRVLSVQPFASGDAVWAPDGRSLLLYGDPSDPWLVTDLQGAWVQRVPSQDAVPLDWREP